MASKRDSAKARGTNHEKACRIHRREFFRRTAAGTAGAFVSLRGLLRRGAWAAGDSAGETRQLPKRPLGKTGLSVSRLGFGGAPLFEEVPTPVPEKTVAKMLDEAMELGLNFVDVSHIYGRGYVESAFGKAIKGKRDKLVIFSRCPLGRGGSASQMVDESLQRLGTDYIDVYGMHGTWMSEDTADRFIEQLLPDLEKAKQAGKIRHIAATCHQAPTAMVKMLKTGKVEVVMMPVNPIWREFLEVVVPVAKKMDVGVVGMKVLWRGRLLVPSPELDGLLGSGPEEKLKSCIGFGLSQDVASLSIGFLEEPHIATDIRAAVTFKGFTEEQQKVLQPKAHESLKQNCVLCNKCLPCPERIEIPRILRLELYARHYGMKEWAKKEYQRVRTKADKCTRCGKCTERCPYGVPAQELVLQAAETLG
jgi:predicted aldo/keto reductase-like oxidoreductase